MQCMHGTPFWPISEWECEFVTISICCFLHIVRLFWQYKYWVVYYDLCQSLSPNIILGATKLNKLYLPTFMRVFGLRFVRRYRKKCWIRSKTLDSLMAWLGEKRKTEFSWTQANQAMSESRIFERIQHFLR